MIPFLCPVFSLLFKYLSILDSKTLTEEQRESIFTQLNEAREMIGWMVEVLSPTYISNSMLRRCVLVLNISQL